MISLIESYYILKILAVDQRNIGKKTNILLLGTDKVSIDVSKSFLALSSPT